jgi:hypothetical protein
MILNLGSAFLYTFISHYGSKVRWGIGDLQYVHVMQGEKILSIVLLATKYLASKLVKAGRQAARSLAKHETNNIVFTNTCIVLCWKGKYVIHYSIQQGVLDNAD